VESSIYMDQVTAARAMLLSEEEALAGNTTITARAARTFGVMGPLGAGRTGMRLIRLDLLGSSEKRTKS